MIPDGQNLFIVDLHYTVPMAEVEPHLDAHMGFIGELVASGFLMVAGRKVPRTGGVIIAVADSIDTVKETMARDPFSINNVAEFRFTEFVPGTHGKTFPS